MNPRVDILPRLKAGGFQLRLRLEQQLRFAVHRPGNPVASPRSHGVPRRDVPGRIHISVTGETAGSAPEHGLTLTRSPVHLPARRAPLARQRGFNLLHPARGLVLDGEVPDVPGVRAAAPQHRLLGGCGDQPVPGHTNTLSDTPDISGEVKRRFLPGLKTGVSTPQP
jgi:hypothetical protein